MVVRGIVCKKCNTFLFSRARHDFRECPCKACAIDGGQEDYYRIIGNPEDFEQGFEADLGTVTREMLYGDYNSGKNKFGCLPFPHPSVYKIETQVH